MKPAARPAGLAALSLALALAPALAAAGAWPQLAALATQVLARGTGGSLPPQLARVLGVGDKGPVAVRQATVRQGGEVHVYNVVEAGNHAVVLLRVGVQGATEALLLGEGGSLARAVSYAGAGEALDLPAAEAEAALEREARLWQSTAGRR